MSRFMKCESFLSYIDSICRIGEPENPIETIIAYMYLQGLTADALAELLALTEDEELSSSCVEDLSCFLKWVETKLEECLHESGFSNPPCAVIHDA